MFIFNYITYNLIYLYACMIDICVYYTYIYMCGMYVIKNNYVYKYINMNIIATTIMYK